MFRLPGIRSNLMCTPSTYKCQICSVIIPAKHKSDHLTVHFKDKISPLLARSAPFSCPKCRYVAIERSSLIRHFATKHGLVDAFLKVNTNDQSSQWAINNKGLLRKYQTQKCIK